MTSTKLIDYLKTWVLINFTGVVTIYFHEGGIRGVKKEEDVK